MQRLAIFRFRRAQGLAAHQRPAFKLGPVEVEQGLSRCDHLIWFDMKLRQHAVERRADRCRVGRYQFARRQDGQLNGTAQHQRNGHCHLPATLAPPRQAGRFFMATAPLQGRAKTGQREASGWPAGHVRMGQDIAPFAQQGQFMLHPRHVAREHNTAGRHWPVVRTQGEPQHMRRQPVAPILGYWRGQGSHVNGAELL